MSQFLHVGVWFNPFAIKLNELANILRTMYHLLHSVISVGVYCVAFSLLTSLIQFFNFSSLLDKLVLFRKFHFRHNCFFSAAIDKYLKRRAAQCSSEDNTSLQVKTDLTKKPCCRKETTRCRSFRFDVRRHSQQV